MTTANWLTLIATLVAIASTWGQLLVRVRVAESSIKDFAKARERQGARIGVAEQRLALLEGASDSEAARGRARTRTRPGGVPVRSEVEADESGADE